MAASSTRRPTPRGRICAGIRTTLRAPRLSEGGLQVHAARPHHRSLFEPARSGRQLEPRSGRRAARRVGLRRPVSTRVSCWITRSPGSSSATTRTWSRMTRSSRRRTRSRTTTISTSTSTPDTLMGNVKINQLTLLAGARWERTSATIRAVEARFAGSTLLGRFPTSGSTDYDEYLPECAGGLSVHRPHAVARGRHADDRPAGLRGRAAAVELPLRSARRGCAQPGLTRTAAR